MPPTSCYNRIQTHGPLLSALLLFLIMQGMAVMAVFSATGGELSYPLDDTYIHMSMAKNMAFHGVWGITPDAFTWSSSSPLWTGLLSVFDRILGAPYLWLPLLLDILCMFGLLMVMDGLFRKHGISLTRRYVALTSLLLVMPVTLQVLSGLEHILQSLLAVLFVYFTSIALSETELAKIKKAQRWLFALAPIIVLVRYEGLFLVFVACVLLPLRRRYREACLLGIIAWLPLLLLGLIALSHGWPIFPHSVLLKSFLAQTQLTPASGTGFSETKGSAQYSLIFLIPFSAFLLSWFYSRFYQTVWERKSIVTLMLGWVALLHIACAQVGWLFRYELYLVVLMVYVLTEVRFSDLLQVMNRFARVNRMALLALSMLLICGLIGTGIYRAAQFSLPAKAAMNIYEQQVQMGKFLAANYNGSSVVANDIGAVNYYADIHCVDYMGLANLQAGQMRLYGTWNKQSLGQLAQAEHARIAIVYAAWLDTIPAAWVRVGTWKLARNYICGDDRVTFFAIGEHEVEPLISALRSYAPHLPKSIKQSGPYCE